MKIHTPKILLVFEAMLILKGITPKKPTDPQKKINDPKGIFDHVIIH